MRLHQVQNKKLDFKFHLLNSDNMQTLLSLENLLKKVSNVEGDIIEFGVGRGRSLIVISYLLSQLNVKKNCMHLIAFKVLDQFTKKINHLEIQKKESGVVLQIKNISMILNL